MASNFGPENFNFAARKFVSQFDGAAGQFSVQVSPPVGASGIDRPHSIEIIRPEDKWATCRGSYFFSTCPITWRLISDFISGSLIQRRPVPSSWF